MTTPSSTPAPCRQGDKVVLLSRRELLTRYADAAAEVELLRRLIRLATTVGRRRTAPVAVPVRLVSRTGGRS